MIRITCRHFSTGITKYCTIFLAWTFSALFLLLFLVLFLDSLFSTMSHIETSPCEQGFCIQQHQKIIWSQPGWSGASMKITQPRFFPVRPGLFPFVPDLFPPSPGLSPSSPGLSPSSPGLSPSAPDLSGSHYFPFCFIFCWLSSNFKQHMYSAFYKSVSRRHYSREWRKIIYTDLCNLI